VVASNQELDAAQQLVDQLEREHNRLVDEFHALVELWGMNAYKAKMGSNKAALQAAAGKLSVHHLKLRGSEPLSFDLAERWDSLSNTEKRNYIAEAFGAIFVDTASDKVDGRRQGSFRPVPERVRILSHEALEALPGGYPHAGRNDYEVARTPFEVFGR
jgi:hypothetical protein